jgi:hypothetical protein
MLKFVGTKKTGVNALGSEIFQKFYGRALLYPATRREDLEPESL